VAKMRRYKHWVYYLLSASIFILILFWILDHGKALQVNYDSNLVANTVVDNTNSISKLLQNIVGNLSHPLTILILQIITILLVARLLGLAFVMIGQPLVIGEILAGIILGPSVMGLLFPSFSAFLFPPQSLQNIHFLSQIGLILFMFVIGMDLDLSIIKNQASDAFIISYASILVPFAMGLFLSYFLYLDYTPANIPFYSFALFICIAMSITAFPVLARIIQEKGWTKTQLGSIAITSAAANDVIAWCLLAVVIALVKAGSIMSALGTIAIASLYICFMILILKPILAKLQDSHPTKETMSKGIIALYFIILMISAYTTELIGIHALFGAFMAGITMPPDRNFRKILVDKIEDISLVLLLPLFFVFTGLRTQLGLLNEGHLWVTFGIVTLVAIVGKFFGSALAARFVGQTWRDSLSLGALMNTRGLMELIVLNIGYDLGVLSPEVFVIMVLMAIVTTFMTGPSLSLINWLFPVNGSFLPAMKRESGNRILISYGPSLTGVKLVRIAADLSAHIKQFSRITTLHFTHGTDLHPLRAEEYANESFKPVLKEAYKRGIEIEPRYKVTDNIDNAILRTAHKGNYDLLLIGAGKAVFKVPLLGWFTTLMSIISNTNRMKGPAGTIRLSGKYDLIHKKARYILEHAPCSVGVFIDREFEKCSRIFLPLLHRDDISLFLYVNYFLMNEGTAVFIFDKNDILSSDVSLKADVESLQNQFPSHLRFVTKNDLGTTGFFDTLDLMLISLKGWKNLVKNHKNWVGSIPSTLVIKQALNPG
jgi:Kef-type K+ transport system membrane component KefB